MYAAPEFDRAGGLVRYRYFTTVREVKAFALEQMRKRGGKGWTYSSFTGPDLARILTEMLPDPYDSDRRARPAEPQHGESR